MMSKDVFDRIGASAPVNKQAAFSSSKGFDYTPSKSVTNAEWDSPPKLKPTLPNQFDLAGIRKGRLVVIGVLEIKKTSKHNRATWVCRCDCSRYVARTAKAINNPENKEDRCSLCKHAAFLQGRHNIKPKTTPPQMNVRVVKTLQWNPFRAETPFGYYHIDDQTDRTADELKGRPPFLLSGSRVDLARYDTLDAARAAAQADFDARILSCLATTEGQP